MSLRHSLIALALLAGMASPAAAQAVSAEPDPTAAQADLSQIPETEIQGVGEEDDQAVPVTPSGMDEARARAFQTEVPPLTPTAAEKREAAVAYMNSALALLDMARAHLRDADSSKKARMMAQAELTAASGKATVAYLMMFHDRAATARIKPLAMRLGDAERLAYHNQPLTALALVDRTQPQLATIYQDQLATMGGGAGRGGSGH